jgi:hypothetical protein
MLRESASLHLARQQREDALVSTVTTISSAALVAIPGLFLTKGISFPNLISGGVLYFGFLCFGLSLFLAFLEQFLSAKAYQKQIEITQAYYRLESEEQEDKVAVKRLSFIRNLCLIVFFVAIIFTAIGLSQIGSSLDGKSATTSTTSATTAASASASAAAAAAAASAASAASAATASNPRRQGDCPKIRPGRGTAAPSSGIATEKSCTVVD